MSTIATLPVSQTQATAGPLTCSLTVTENGRRTHGAHIAEWELTNISTTPIEIEYRMTALQHLNLVVSKTDGGIVSTGHFGDRFAPTLEPKILRLEPGATFKAAVHLFATVPQDPLPPGSYLVQAVYDYRGLRCVSEPLEVRVAAKT